jgi:hypothetical protein
VSGSVWIASYVLLWLAVLVLAVTVVALLRQIGVLHARLRPVGTHFAGEGPERLAPAPPAFDYARASMTLVAFFSPSCEICHALRPGLAAIRRSYRGVEVQVVEHGPGTEEVFAAFNVRSTPYFVTVDEAGIVKVRGIANTLDQLEVMLEESFTEEVAADGG